MYIHVCKYVHKKTHTHIFIDHTDIDKPIIPLHKIPIKSMYHCKVLSFTVVHRILSTRHKVALQMDSKELLCLAEQRYKDRNEAKAKSYQK